MDLKQENVFISEIETLLDKFISYMEIQKKEFRRRPLKVQTIKDQKVEPKLYNYRQLTNKLSMLYTLKNLLGKMKSQRYV